MDYKSKIILIAGPTASGKSKIGINLAKKINGEIINADSMQVYKQLKILTARPSEKDQKTIKHHLFGIIDVRKRFSTGQWLKKCIKIINLIRKKNKAPIIVGGTGLYFKALTEGLVKIPQVEKKDFSYLNPTGRWMMGNHYHKKNPTIFEGIDTNDIQRVSRAISVYEGTGLTLKEWQSKENKKYFKSTDFIKLCISPSKSELEKKINKRFNQMLKKGALQEVRKYKKSFLEPSSSISANSIIGIYEIGLYLQNQLLLKSSRKEC